MNDQDKQYILMCQEAKKLQEQWQPSIGDVYAHINYDKWDRGPRIIRTAENYHRDNKRFYIWLPSQSQLQGMLKSGRNAWGEMQRVVVWAKEEMSRNYFSMEILWLSYVMHELYQKKWTGKEWVNERAENKYI